MNAIPCLGTAPWKSCRLISSRSWISVVRRGYPRGVAQARSRHDPPPLCSEGGGAVGRVNCTFPGVWERDCRQPAAARRASRRKRLRRQWPLPQRHPEAATTSCAARRRHTLRAPCRRRLLALPRCSCSAPEVSVAAAWPVWTRYSPRNLMLPPMSAPLLNSPPREAAMRRIWQHR